MASYQPQMPEARRGMPLWVKILLAVGVLFIVGVLGVAGVTYYFVQKIANEPGGPIVMAIRMSNPDYDIISVDEKNKTIVVRHKKTGKEGAIALERFNKAKNAVIDPAEIGLSNEEAGVLTMPTWLVYPGSTVVSKAGGSQNMQTTLETEDDTDKVLAYYEEKLKANAYDVSSVSFTRTVTGTKAAGVAGQEARVVLAQVMPSGSSKNRVLIVLK